MNHTVLIDCNSHQVMVVNRHASISPSYHSIKPCETIVTLDTANNRLVCAIFIIIIHKMNKIGGIAITVQCIQVWFNDCSVSQLLYDQFSTPVINELVLLEDVTFIEGS